MMETPPFRFEVRRGDSSTQARRGTLFTPHGPVETPAFMPVATQATVKGLLPEEVRATGTQMVLANTYHLALRPGQEVIRQLGGLHRFMQWPGPILTDSGGYQLYSLAQMTQVTDRAAVFRSHIDGSQVVLGPERAVEIQEALGSDVAMVLDHVIGLPAEPASLRQATERTVRWAERSLQVRSRPDQALFAIVQGGTDQDLRHWCVERLRAMPFEGFAIGGLGLGETRAELYETVRCAAPALPGDRPRYLMGLGRPADLLEAISAGVDLFDCVVPTRNGRNAMAFTDQGILRLRNRCYQNDARPLEETCACSACRFSRAYLRHLFVAGEMLGPILLSIHNITYYQRLMSETRSAIAEGRFAEFCEKKRHGWSTWP